MSVERIGHSELISRLDARFDPSRPSALVFDGDGTLWSGDVAEDVFRWAVQSEAILADARDELERTARAHGFSPAETPSATAARLFEGYLDGKFPERTVCEVMTWCFAGYRLAELRQNAREVLALTGIGDRINRKLERVFEWARAHGVRTVVVSASPQWIVEEAASHWSIAPMDIYGSRPKLEGDRVLPGVGDPVPYAEQKLHAGRDLIGDGRWLASFGDSVFDFEMLEAAEIGVAVRPKPELRSKLEKLPHALILE